MPDIVIQKASLHILVAFDVGFEIKLPLIREIFSNELSSSKKTSFLELGRAITPVRIIAAHQKITLHGQDRDFAVALTFFDIGALSVEFISNRPLTLEEMPRLAAIIQKDVELLKCAEKIARATFERARPAVINAEFLNQPSVFTVFNIQTLESKLSAQKIIELGGARIAQTLRLSDEAVGTTEVVRAINPNITYSDDDVVFTSAKVAVIFDETSSEVIDLFELANVQSLELSYLDAKLDRHLQKLYDENEQLQNWSYIFKNLFESNTRKLNTIHLDTTILVERVEQGFKFAADSYLTRIHELAVEKMFLGSLSRGINRKLDAIRDIFRDQRDRAASMRMEILEWIIIALIAFEVVPVLLSKLR